MEISKITKERLKEFLSEDKRFDGRKLLDFRDIVIETGISKNAEGSAKVKIGDTEVVAGVKIDVTEPYPDHEDEGTLITTVELLPLSSPEFESGPPRIEAIEIARIVDRGVRESGFIDFKKLCIKEGEKVYGIFLDIYSLNSNGNLIDAACLAAVAALRTAKMPKYDAKLEKVKYGELTSKDVPLEKNMPLTITFHKIGEKILVDPISEEEKASEARLSIALSEDKEVLINAVQKGEAGVFSEEEAGKIIDLAAEKFKEYKKLVEKALGK
jgi:exosome complex component RRP42